MSDAPIRFSDGAAYDRGMGVWSRQVGETFLDWLAPPAGWRWLDVGCGSGAVTAMLMQRCAPAAMQGIDASPAQLDFARTRSDTAGAQFHLGDAMALPFGDRSFDAALMTLVIFFVPDPARAVAEMVRVVRPGGLVAAYAWDLLEGASPFAPIEAELRGMGRDLPRPPSAGVSRMPALRELWLAAGLQQVETRAITVQRRFADFDAFWNVSSRTGRLAQVVAAMASDDVARLQAGVRARLQAAPDGSITYASRANAIRGQVAG